MTIQEAIAKALDGSDFTRAEACEVMNEIMTGQTTDAQIAGFLVALRAKGETSEEIAGCADAMRSHVVTVKPTRTDLVDVVGTGGDGQCTINISTAAALVAAAAGAGVAKHGNRAASSACGSADVLEALGIATDLNPEEAGEALQTDGFAFLFAQTYHPAMKHAGPTRREIGVRTAFNLLGPITNPAGARRQVVGVGDPAAAPKLAEVLRLLGTEHALVVHGKGVDELPLDGTDVLYDVTPAGVTRHEVVAAELGLEPATVEALAGGTREENAVLIETVLGGRNGPRRDVVLLNAAAAFLAAGRVPDLRAGIGLAADTIASGAATDLLARLRAAKTARDAARMEVAPA